MGCRKNHHGLFFWTGLILGALAIFLPPAYGQDYPNKPITIYAGFEAGGGTDITARGLAAGAEKLLGVPVVVENKPGGTGTVCATLLASKKPDGYTLGAISSATLATMPHLVSVSFDPLKDFTLLCYYSRNTGALTVLSESPFKTLDDFITHAKAHPGLTYTSAGLHSSQQLATEAFAKCKGLVFKHIPTKGGAEAYRQLLGKHCDFVSGSGSHLIYVKQGLFRQLLMYHLDKRDPDYPDVPFLKEIGCQDVPSARRAIVAPRGLPQPIIAKLIATFRKVAEGEEFQSLLKRVDIPYDYKEGIEFENDVKQEYYWYKDYFGKAGIKKK